ncbi:trypsin inhibitor ClTI-1-like isoform X2 [Heptranchias perlo]|uniref:trypsin inhibitor ClTI-1-like isoform X2 n=1 Tax=Heptranchias perlo TaxID=212740 RepID=UPI00355A9168
MKTARLSLLTALVVLVVDLESVPRDIYMLDCTRFPTRMFCNDEFDLVCGTDDQNYGNPCILCEYNRLNNKSIGIRNPGFCRCPGSVFGPVN